MSSYTISPDLAAAVAAMIPPGHRRGAGRFYYEAGSLYVAAELRPEVEAALAVLDPTAPVVPLRRFGFLGFMNLFTPVEREAIVNSSKTDVKLFLLMAAGAEYIDLDDQRTAQGVQSLVEENLITAGRFDDVMAGKSPG